MLRIEENEASEEEECDMWEDGGDVTIPESKGKCELCMWQGRPKHLWKHMMIKHDCKYSTCSKCHRNVMSIELHNCSIKNSDLAECDVCGKKIRKTMYTRHMKRKHGWGNSNYPKCTRCGQRTNRYSKHKCFFSKTKSACPDCGTQTFFLANHMASKSCMLKAAVNERRKGKAERCRVEDSTVLKIFDPVIPPDGSPTLPPYGVLPPPPELATPDPLPGGSGGSSDMVKRRSSVKLKRKSAGKLKRESGGKAKPAMVAPEPACEYERIRAANIAEREAMFQALGIQGHVREVKEK